MRITKFGHACLLVEDTGLRLLIDPGIYSTDVEELKELTDVWITHEHSDHFDDQKLLVILKQNPNARVITNQNVTKLITELKPEFHGRIQDTTTLESSVLQSTGEFHAPLHASIPPIPNTGVIVNNRFFYPGDNLVVPKYPIEILALPVAGPWLKLSDATDYAIRVKPNICFPVHDGILKQTGTTDRLPGEILPHHGINWQVLAIGTPIVL